MYVLVKKRMLKFDTDYLFLMELNFDFWRSQAAFFYAWLVMVTHFLIAERGIYYERNIK